MKSNQATSDTGFSLLRVDQRISLASEHAQGRASGMAIAQLRRARALSESSNAGTWSSWSM